MVNVESTMDGNRVQAMTSQGEDYYLYIEVGQELANVV